MKNTTKSPKNPTLLDQFCMKFDTLFTLCMYSARLEKKKDPFYVDFWMSLIPPLDIQEAPLGVNSLLHLKPIYPLWKIYK